MKSKRRQNDLWAHLLCISRVAHISSHKARTGDRSTHVTNVAPRPDGSFGEAWLTLLKTFTSHRIVVVARSIPAELPKNLCISGIVVSGCWAIAFRTKEESGKKKSASNQVNILQVLRL